MNPDTCQIRIRFAGIRCGRGNFWIRKEKVVDSKYPYTCGRRLIVLVSLTVKLYLRYMFVYFLATNFLLWCPEDLLLWKADQTVKSLVMVILLPSISDRQILPSMSDSFYSFGSILLEILSFLYRHLLTFCIEAGLVCKRTINFKLETQVKKHSLHFTSFSNAARNSWCRPVIMYRRLLRSGYPNVFGYHLLKFSDSNS